MTRPPHDGPAFENLMGAIDQKLSNDGVEIASRPLLAVREVSLRFDLSLPIGKPSARAPADLRENAIISEAIMRWYQENYGDRLKTDPTPGGVVILLDGDLYVLKVPRIFGSVEFILSREWLPKPGISRGPVKVNVAQLITDMKARKLARLSDGALDEIAKAFKIVLPAAYVLETTDHRLMYHARGDVNVAISNLMERGGRYGESKWASLQAAEKVLKAAIDLAGGSFKYTHKLAELCAILERTGLNFEATRQVEAIQCAAGIRYGEETCSREEALRAHHASLQLVNILRDAGADFDLGLGH